MYIVPDNAKVEGRGVANIKIVLAASVTTIDLTIPSFFAVAGAASGAAAMSISIHQEQAR